MQDESLTVNAPEDGKEELLNSDAVVDAACDALNVAVMSRDEIAIYAAAKELRKTISKGTSPPVQRVIDHGIAADVIGDILREYWRSNEALCFEVLWILTNISSGTSEQTEFVVNLDVLPEMRDVLFESQSQACIEQATWCLGNISGDSPGLRGVVRRLGIAEAVANRFLDPDTRLTLKRRLAWLGSNLCRNKPVVDIQVVQPILAATAVWIMHPSEDDSEILKDSLWTLSYCTDNHDFGIEAVLNTGVLPTVCNIGISNADNASMLTPALRLVANIALGTIEQINIFFESNGLALLSKAIGSKNKVHRREVCWCLSNLAAGPVQHREILFKHIELLDEVFALSESDQGDVILPEICRFFSNLIDGSPVHLLQVAWERFPITQILLLSYTQKGDVRELSRYGLRTLLQVSFSNSMQELRSHPNYARRTELVKLELAKEIVYDERLRESEISDLVWILLAMGLPDRQRRGDGKSICIFARGYAPPQLKNRLRSLRNLTLLLGLSGPLKNRLQHKRVWLSGDHWRLVWRCVFE